MMQKKILSLIILSLLFGGVVFAQDDSLPKPGLTPDSSFYFLERITEGIGTFFTFGDLKKAERHALLAAERLAEAQAVVEKGKPELVEKILERYENQLVKALIRTEKAKTKGKNTNEVAKTITEATQKHLTVLEKVLEKVPEEAKPAIRHAMVVSTKEGLETASEVASDQDLSLRDICIKKGEPSEICEKIPLQGFESFEQMETFCKEIGEPPEQCALFKDKCREFGVTIPDECLLFLSTAPTAIIENVTTSVREELEKEKAGQVKESGFQDFELIKAKCLESGAPSNVCNSIKEALASSKPLRTLCLEEGGTQEMCEMIPSKNFESFKEIRDFCTEQGGPPELCETLENKCKELGITKADACFRVLSISSVTTFQTTSPTSVLKPT